MAVATVKKLFRDYTGGIRGRGDGISFVGFFPALLPAEKQAFRFDWRVGELSGREPGV